MGAAAFAPPHFSFVQERKMPLLTLEGK